MAGWLRIVVEPPVHGWATVRLAAQDVELEFVASYTPWDSIADLARAATGLLAGLPELIVTWNTEPREYEFRFVTANGRTRLEICEFADSRRSSRRTNVLVGVVGGDARDVAREIWRGLRRLQTAVSPEGFAAEWGHAFPVATVERLGEQLKGHRAAET